MSRLLALLATGLTVTQTTIAEAQTAPGDTAAARTAITALGAKLSAANIAGDAAGIAALFTEDARAEYAGFPSAVGRAAIQSTYETLFKTTKYKVWELVVKGVNAPTADVASAGGSVHQFGETNGKPSHMWWRWAAAYRKGADGQYKISFVMAFPDSTK